MSLLGIDVGTTGCKASVFSVEGDHLATYYREYDIQSPASGQAQLDTPNVWLQIKAVIADAVRESAHDPVTALSVSSLGEAVVPVTADREMLAPSILNFDTRGEEFIGPLSESIDNTALNRITGNTLGNHFSLTKLMWIRRHQQEIYDKTYKFLPWSAFVPFMLSSEPVVDYSLANRMLLLDVSRADWSDEMIRLSGIDAEKLPGTAPSGTVIGQVSTALAKELGLGRNVSIVTGVHDQCANAVGCGVCRAGSAMFGMGTYHCIVLVFDRRQDPDFMLKCGLNTEHHAAADRFVSFVYNHGGSLVKWYRDTFAFEEHRRAKAQCSDVYPELFNEMSDSPSSVLVLPHFAPTGPPEFITDSSGVMVGLKLETKRSDILRAICEGTIYYMRDAIEPLNQAGLGIDEFRAVGGGSKSDAWLQIAADILQKPFVRPKNTEAGTLGAAILAGLGTNVFSSAGEAAVAMVEIDRTFEPNTDMQTAYDDRFTKHRQLWPTMENYLQSL